MADMWRSRPPPTPLVFEQIKAGNFVPRERPTRLSSAAEGITNGTRKSNGTDTPNTNGASLKDQKSLTLQENLALFISRSVTVFIIGLTQIKSS
jgi:ubiquitin-like 1-activating enzyme E1 B